MEDAEKRIAKSGTEFNIFNLPFLFFSGGGGGGEGGERLFTITNFTFVIRPTVNVRNCINVSR